MKKEQEKKACGPDACQGKKEGIMGQWDGGQGDGEQGDRQQRVMGKAGRGFIKGVLPLLVLAAGAGIMGFLIANRERPQPVFPESPGILVETRSLALSDVPVRVRATGTLTASREAAIAAEVSGRVLHLHPRLEVGGFIGKDEILFVLDDTDYRLARMAAEAELARTEALLLEEEGRGLAARADWDLSHPGKTPDSPLVLREPQRRQAEAAVAAARAAVARHGRDMARCTVKAPFDLRVMDQSLAPGSFLMAGQSVMQVAATASADLLLSLSPSDLDWLLLPEPGAEGDTPVEIRIPEAPQARRSGVLLRVLGDVEPKGRMTRILVRIPDPYGLREKNSALNAGQFVEALIPGRVAERVLDIEASVLREESRLWWMDSAGTLRMEKVEVLRRTGDRVLLRTDLPEGTDLVVSAIGGAVEGMKLRAAQAGKE